MESDHKLSGAIITGAQGFFGRYTAHCFQRNSVPVWPTQSDLLHSLEIKEEIKNIGPSKSIFHFAGISTIKQADENRQIVFDINTTASVDLARSFWQFNPEGRFYFASTGQVYAAVEDSEEVTLTESSPVKPRSVYAESKWVAEQRLVELSQRQGFRLTVLRFFNHTHKSQSAELFLPYIYDSLIRLKKVQVPVGNVEVSRDIGSIVDLVNAMKQLHLSHDQKTIEIFNVSTGQARKMSDLAMGLAARIGKPLELVIDPQRLRTDDVRLIRGDCTRLSRLTKSQPRATNIDCFYDDFLSEAF